MAFRNEADRVAASRAAKAQDMQSRAAEEGRNKTRAAILAQGKQVEELIPEVLDELAARGYPGIEEITVQVPRIGPGRLLGPTRETKAGAYSLSAYSYGESRNRPAGTDYVRLLSSGRLVVGSWSYSVREFVQEVLNRAGVGEPGRGNDLAAFSAGSLRVMVDELKALLAGG